MGIALLGTAVKVIFVSQALAQDLQSRRSVLVQVGMRVRATIASVTLPQDLPCPNGQVAVLLATGVKATTACRQGELGYYELLKTILKLSRNVQIVPMMKH